MCLIDEVALVFVCVFAGKQGVVIPCEHTELVCL